MNETITVDRGGLELLSEAQPLWEALYDRHLEYGAAGVATIEREESWPRRLAHYQRIFATHSHPIMFLARLDGEAIGYALGYEEEHLGEPAVVLETLSLLPVSRGHGLGIRLMRLLMEDAKGYGAARGIVDVVTGNAPAFGFYLNAGFTPHSETWMRSEQWDGSKNGLPADIAERAKRLGFEFDAAPGPDDTWISSERMAHLNVTDTGGCETPPDIAMLRAFFQVLEAAGLWSIQVTISTSPQSDPWRDALTALRFKSALQRLTRPI